MDKFLNIIRKLLIFLNFAGFGIATIIFLIFFMKNYEIGFLVMSSLSMILATGLYFTINWIFK